MTEIILPYKPAKGKQLEYFNLNTRFTIGNIGRQFGKSTMAGLRHFKKAITKPGIYWWVSPIIEQARVQFRRMSVDYKDVLRQPPHKSLREIYWPNGSITKFTGSENKDNLRGETLHGITLDESASHSPEVWPEIVQPMLAVQGGWADLIGTPKGLNWFYDIWNHAKDDKDWSRIHATSKDSPYFSEDEYERIKKVTPEMIFQQEYEAQFVDIGGQVFRNIRECVGNPLSEPILGRKYFAGIDLARTTDFTVIIVMNDKREVVYFDRFQDRAWSVQKAQIERVLKKYDALGLIDSTGVGDPIFDDLCRSGVRVQEYKFTNQSKRIIIEDLILTFEEMNIKLPNIEELIYELSIFEVEQLPSGLIRYSAPPGKHDDICIALALANYITPDFSGSIISAGGERATSRSIYE